MRNTEDRGNYTRGDTARGAEWNPRTAFFDRSSKTASSPSRPCLRGSTLGIRVPSGLSYWSGALGPPRSFGSGRLGFARAASPRARPQVRMRSGSLGWRLCAFGSRSPALPSLYPSTWSWLGLVSSRMWRWCGLGFDNMLVWVAWLRYVSYFV